MNLKEAFRYQNKLQQWMQEATYILHQEENVTRTESTALLRKVRQERGALDCATLLRTSAEAGIPRKNHCDGIVFEMLQVVEDIINA